MLSLETVCNLCQQSNLQLCKKEFPDLSVIILKFKYFILDFQS